ncbi:MAG: signal recognition particle subunit SRP19/SEC65 family protein [Candidatus Thermoplasmatota archaeon]|nr:signal recognition particle subunit SRP19/SEC65 family protein [Candidatus Thermoplasmatota archaeon]
MVIKRSHETRIVIWPHYFDRRVSRSDGRRIPRKLSVEKPGIERIIQAAQAAGLKFEIDQKASHPFFWWEKTGRILVVSEEPKTKVIRRISQNLRQEEAEKPVQG